ncbi:MAG: MFS transporter [Betaproteobacteria bacterium]|nr:MAG: MFS transporter [Betaproteobacteria bacterium]
MKLAAIVLLTVLAHTGFVGSRMLVSLYAIHRQASPFTIGLLMALYALLPMLLAVSAGRLIDRVGTLRPLAWSGLALVAGLALPYAWPALPGLFVAATLIGTAFMVVHVSLNHAVGSMGTPADRAVNFSWFSLAFSISGFCGPLLTGLSIDAAGHRPTFLLLAAFPAAGLMLLYLYRHAMPHRHGPRVEGGQRRIADLLREPRLRGAFIASGLLAMGWDLYTFVMPIFGSAIGLRATTIGVIMGSFAAATFTVRLLMPVIARRLREWTVVTAAMTIAGSAYALFPLVNQVPLLMALSFLLGIGLGCAQPMIMALLYAASPAGRQGEVVGVRTTLLNASHTLLPLAFGALAALGMGPVFWLMTALLLSGSVYAQRQRAARR